MRYRITFYDFWHLSSGLSGGVALDSLTVKDTFGLPYVPGKTFKGLVREQVELLDLQRVERIFGAEGSKEGEAYFSNAMLDEKSVAQLKANPQLVKFLYDKITSTKIDSNGVADDKTLREVEVVVPLTLEGEIVCSQADETLLEHGMKMIKQMGLNRNRGLGRCRVEVVR